MNAPRDLPTPIDRGATGAVFRDLLVEWKAAGRAAKDVDDTLWQRFKAAQDTFFSARTRQTPSATRSSTPTRMRRKELLAEAERLDTSDLDAAGAALRVIGDKWNRAARCRASAVRSWNADCVWWRRRYVTRRRAEWDPEAQARADQFRARAEQYERQAEKAAAAGREKGRRAGARERRAMAPMGRRGGRGARQALGPRLGVLGPARRRRPCRGRRVGLCAVAVPRGGGVLPRRRAVARCAPTPPEPSCRSPRSRRSTRRSARCRDPDGRERRLP